ncbi:hypothetical protein KL86PLE_90524 [uncultured Pleomorphomonas sp.]|uniref:Uncharacterized protein n=1 Tax=uncultured Pleomorphomonas sp. TaxID=442121 RepID=A0A212LQ58_9HYPH|nr:hypothetical protein KL86PLE_90524 [uncultured Pleomorphomonas sp.]
MDSIALHPASLSHKSVILRAGAGPRAEGSEPPIWISTDIPPSLRLPLALCIFPHP